MLLFKKLELTDIEIIKPYFKLSKNRSCDNTVGGTFIWRDFFSMEYAEYNRNFIFRGRINNNNNIVFAMPLGRNYEEIKDSLNRIEIYCRENKIRMIIFAATDEDTEIIGSVYKNINKIYEGNSSDYLYKASDLAELSGRKYNGQRNHINYFRRNFVNHEIKGVNKDNLGDIRNFLVKHIEKNQSYYENSPALTEEAGKIFEILDNFEIYGQTGIILYINGLPAGFALGEVCGDTLFVHAEKADISFRGAYQTIVNEFAKYIINNKNNIEYINREDDAGDENLRISKMSYHPCNIIKKYTVEIL
ncbi:MAG: phosphatidylglycerol lysyltransferase domain-containing protein [Oscillospiraceae bacterium]|nr:phosphatidylglycerol lysyltransferase domain-containing protein [Oscillospiraceae bacterium]